MREKKPNKADGQQIDSKESTHWNESKSPQLKERQFDINTALHPFNTPQALHKSEQNLPITRQYIYIPYRNSPINAHIRKS